MIARIARRPSEASRGKICNPPILLGPYQTVRGLFPPQKHIDDILYPSSEGLYQKLSFSAQNIITPNLLSSSLFLPLELPGTAIAGFEGEADRCEILAPKDISSFPLMSANYIVRRYSYCAAFSASGSLNVVCRGRTAGAIGGNIFCSIHPSLYIICQ